MVNNGVLIAEIAALVAVMGLPCIQAASVDAHAPTIMKKSLISGGLNVLLQTSPYPPVRNVQTLFKITFTNVDTNEVQPHVDYDFILTKGGRLIFRASDLVANPYPVLHTAAGVVMIRYLLHESGSYLANVTVYGNEFVPIRPEFVLFPINVI